MKKLILTIAMLVMLVPMANMAFTLDENCEEAIRFDWHCDSCNSTCLFALMADILGPGPDGVW